MSNESDFSFAETFKLVEEDVEETQGGSDAGFLISDDNEVG